MKYVAIYCQLYRVSLILTDLKSILYESHVNMEISLISLKCLFNVNSLILCSFVLVLPLSHILPLPANIMKIGQHF